jgi:hypothetical protein
MAVQSFGQYYKTINYNCKVRSYVQQVAIMLVSEATVWSITDAARVILYDRNMFKIQAKGCLNMQYFQIARLLILLQP